MRALIISPTGTNTKYVLERLRSFYKDFKNLSDNDLHHLLEYYILEDEIKQICDFRTYLDTNDYNFQESQWETAYNNILNRIDEDNPHDVLLAMNYPFFRNDRFFPALNLQLFNKFKPEKIITLIDDAYATWRRIRLRENIVRTRSRFKLRDMFTWRSTSILLGDMLAKNLNIKNYVIAVKHPIKTIYRLTFERNPTIIYASFPITSTRNDPEKRKEIDEIRRKLTDNFCTLDPLTIDERILQFAYEKNRINNKVTVLREYRWPLEDYTVAEDDIWDNDGKFSVSSYEIEELLSDRNDKSVIDKHIEYRDFRYINQSNYVIAYRPNYGGRISQGVTAELHYAINTVHKSCYVCYNKSDGDINDTPFATNAIILDSIDEIIEEVKREIKSINHL